MEESEIVLYLKCDDDDDDKHSNKNTTNNLAYVVLPACQVWFCFTYISHLILPLTL